MGEKKYFNDLCNELASIDACIGVYCSECILNSSLTVEEFAEFRKNLIITLKKENNNV